MPKSKKTPYEIWHAKKLKIERALAKTNEPIYRLLALNDDGLNHAIDSLIIARNAISNFLANHNNNRPA